MTSSAEDLIEAFNRATGEFKLCPNRVWAVGKEHLPLLLPPTGSRLPRHDSHEQCTVDFCEHSQRDFTGVSQRHECEDEDECLPLEGLFSAEILFKAALSATSTVWALDGKTMLTPPRPYMAISHVWSDGTGAGAWPAGQVNRCLYKFFAEIAESFQCEGIWWDTLCVPREKAARTQAIRKIQSNYQDARITLVHDCYLRNWEWTDPEAACFAILMSPWFSRAWTALELSKSQKVKVVFKGRNGRPLIKDLDEEILPRYRPQYSAQHREATRIIGALRNGVVTVDNLLIALGHRYTSWPKDRAIVSGLLVGIDVAPVPPQHDIWQQDIYQAIVRKIGGLSHEHLFHNKATMTKVCWCPTSLFDMPQNPEPVLLRVTERLDVVGRWTLIPISAIPASHYIWDNVHPLVRTKIGLGLREPSKHLLLASPSSSLVNRALFVKEILKEHASTILGYQYIGAVYFSPAMTKDVISRDTGGLSEKEVVLLGNPEHLPDDRGKANVNVPLGDWQPNTLEGEWSTMMGDDNQAKYFLAAAQPLARDPISQRTSLHYAVWRGYSHIIRQIASATNIDALDSLSQNPLHLAAERSNEDIVKHLLSVAHEANRTPKVLEARGYNGQTPLHYAACAGSRINVNILIEKGADVNAENDDGLTPLHLVAEKGLEELCTALLRTGRTNLNAMSKHGFTPLHLAIMGGHSAVVECLIREGADVRARDNEFGWAPLHCAVETGSCQTVELLLRHGADIDVRDVKLGWTPLHLAAIMGHQAAAELLVSHGAEVGVKDNKGWTPLLLADTLGVMYAETEAYQAIVGLIERHGDGDNETHGVTWTPLHVTALNTQRGLVKLLAQETGNIKQTGDENGTPLHWASQRGQEIAANLLILLGEDVDAPTAYGKTPLHCAAKGGHADIIKLLINSECQLNAVDSSNQSAIHFAAESGDEYTIRLLLDKGQSPNQECNNWPPLHVAARGGHKGAVQLLINRGAEINTIVHSSTPLAEAITGGHEDIVRLLVTRGADVNKGNVWQRALHCAVANGHEGIATFLLEEGADIQAATTKGTALHYAVSRNSLEMTFLLITYAADVNAQTATTEETPLAIAAKEGNMEITKMLLDSGADISMTNLFGYTALHRAAWNGHKEVVHLLLENGAAIDSRDRDGMLPAECARRGGHEEVAKLLEEMAPNIV